MVGDALEGDSKVTSIYPAPILEDLARSGLDPTDMRVRPLGPTEKALCGVPQGQDGYIIPYFDMMGKPLPFYRAKLYQPPDSQTKAPKYRQPAESQNHVYFPPKFRSTISVDQSRKFILLVEGEKKAAAGVKHGWPCASIGGVDSWRTRTLVLPKDTALSKTADGRINAKLPSGGLPGESGGEALAIGLGELIAWCIKTDTTIIICFDADEEGSIRTKVQTAAAQLGFELRFRGLPHKGIKQLILPPLRGGKIGLDDFLLSDEKDAGVEGLRTQISLCFSKRSAFPLHPNIRGYVNQKLQRANLSRQEIQSLSIAILTDLDTKGQRLRSSDSGKLYYFSGSNKSLTPVSFTARPEFAESPFGRFLYREYNLSLVDQKALGWLSTQFSAEDPISSVSPERVLAWRDDTLYYQLDDGVTARVTRTGIKLIANGDDGVLFESGLVSGLDYEDVHDSIRVVQAQPPKNWWLEVLKDARIRDSEEDSQRRLLSLLYYISPLFYRWRGTQLPVEITTGEAGSGKSTLFELRLNILTGVPKLRNAPNDIKDWNAGISGTGAIHVTDNLQLTNGDMRQRISDEICRLVTEPNPAIEQRKLYTDTDIIKIPVRCTFAVTAIRQPFTNIDIIQRSIITELDKGTSSELSYDAYWKEHQLERFGSRSMWVAHQLVFVQRMLQSIHQNWVKDYKAKYRLINVEQLLRFAAKIYGWHSAWIPEYLEKSREARASETDWTLEGLQAYAAWIIEIYPERWEKFRFACGEVASWATAQEEYAKCNLLNNARSLEKYIRQHQHTIAMTSKIVPALEIHPGGRQMYRIKTEKDN